MRLLVSMTFVLLAIAGSVSLFTATAQEPALADLLPTAEEIGPGFVVTEDRARTLDEQATAFANGQEAARLLADRGWQANAFRVYGSNDGAATVDISLTRFASAGDAADAMPFFVADRAGSTGQREAANPPAIGDEARALSGPLNGGIDDTLYVRSGDLLLRVSVTATPGSAPLSPEQIARQIIARAEGAPPVTLAQAASPALAALLPGSLPLDVAECFSIAGEGALDDDGLAERLAGGSEAMASVAAMGWRDGAFRQYACDPPPGRAGWVDLSVHAFGDAQAAADAVLLFAGARAVGMNLEPALAIGLGERSAALTGRAVNGTEYTLYFSSGPALFAVTGVAPRGDPRADVETIATALAERILTTPLAVDPLPAPTLQPVAVATTTTTTTTAPIPAPTIAPLAPPTAIPPTATFAPVPTTIPVTIPTAVPAAVPTTIPTTVPVTIPTPPPTAVPTAPVTIPTAPPVATTRPTATTPAGPLPTPTPRVIRPPVQTGD